MWGERKSNYEKNLQITYYLYDHLGNSRVVFHTKQDKCSDDPEYVAEYVADYYPFGKILREWAPCQIERYLTTYHERDKGSGYDNRGARFYDSELGRFLSTDPMAADFAAWSTYNYAFDNPVMYTDPTGMAPEDIILKGSNNSSVTIKTDLVDIELDASSVVGDLGGNYSLEGDAVVEAALDIGGAIDPTGVIDGAAAVYYAQKGEYGNAAISGLSIIPYLGDLSKAGRIGGHISTIRKAIGNAKGGGVRVRHYTDPNVLKKIKAEGKITSGGRAAPFGVDVEVAPFGSRRTARSDLGAQGSSYVEFTASKAELTPIPGSGGRMGHQGRNTARIVRGETRQAAEANPVQLKNRNPSFKFSRWWR